jgi:hypothetical protein
MRHATNEHLAQLDPGETRVSGGLGNPTTQADQGLQMLGYASYGSMRHNHGTKN